MPKTARPLPGYLVDRYRGWKALHFEENRAWFASLARHGQRPRAMVVSCCDSRVDVTGLFGAEPGDLFVVRNVANLIPPYAPSGLHHGSSAAVEYAVTVLGVAHIVVIGHSNCGGVEACHDMCSGRAPQLEGETSFIGRWLDILRPGYARLPADLDREHGLAALEREGVLVSLRNLESFPFVAQAVAAGMLTLHGAWMDIADGKLHVFSPESRTFAPVEG
jgi:carbonic anhydrase